MTPETIPAELRDDPHWVVWRWIERDGRRTKPPFDPRTDRPGDATDRNLWMPFDRAISLLPRYDGVGWAVTQDSPYSGVDLDHCISEDGTLATWALEIVRRLDSYTEYTPSGVGLRIWCRGKLPEGRRRKGPVEMYDRGRYFTVTGERFEHSRREIMERTAELAALHADLFKDEVKQPRIFRPDPLSLSDDEVLRKAFQAKNGPALQALMEGDLSAHGGDQSAADLALCSHLAFWFRGDAQAIDRVFRRSGLMRAKWERADYREKTILRALQQTSYYDPGRSAQPPTPKPHNGNGAPPRGPSEGDGNNGGNPEAQEKLKDPHRLARVFLARNFTHADGLTLRYWGEEWHRWDGHAWRNCPAKELQAELTGSIKAEFGRWARMAQEEAEPVTIKLVSDAMGALKSLALLPLHRVPAQPAWLNREPGEDLPDPIEVIACSNTLVHLGDPVQTIPLTPRFFSPHSLGYAYNAHAPEPVQWLKFLNSLWPNDPETIGALQEWFGYLLTLDTSQQKILLLHGPKRSGKGTIARVLRRLLGEHNTANPTLSGLTTAFGMASLIGKSLAVVGDARLSSRQDQAVIVERLLSISGEDAQTIDRKYLSSWCGVLPTRFLLLTNELPRLADASGALPSRFIVFDFNESFFGREDHDLDNKLYAELPSILLWSIEGWRRLRARGRLTQPLSAAPSVEEMGELASPVKVFVEDCCTISPEATVAIKDLFDAWVVWCAQHGRAHPGDEQLFGRNLRAAFHCIRSHRPRTPIGRIRKYVGIALNAATEF